MQGDEQSTSAQPEQNLQTQDTPPVGAEDGPMKDTPVFDSKTVETPPPNPAQAMEDTRAATLEAAQPSTSAAPAPEPTPAEEAEQAPPQPEVMSRPVEPKDMGRPGILLDSARELLNKFENDLATDNRVEAPETYRALTSVVNELGNYTRRT